MSVRKGDRSLSKIEVLYQSLKLREAILDLSFRSFGIRSRNSPFRRKYQHIISLADEPDRVDTLIIKKRDLLERYSNEVSDLLNAANAIFPKFKNDAEQRLSYQNQALAICEMISNELNEIVRIFDVDIRCFKTVVSVLEYEKHLIREWRKSDRQRFKGYFL